MDKELISFVTERADILAKSDFSTQVTKDAAKAWKDAVDANEEAAEEATEKLLDTLEGRPTTIDGVIGFLQGPAKEMLGEEAAAQGLAVQLKRKKEGAKWCDCEACAAIQILAKFGRIELWAHALKQEAIRIPASPLADLLRLRVHCLVREQLRHDAGRFPDVNHSDAESEHLGQNGGFSCLKLIIAAVPSSRASAIQDSRRWPCRFLSSQTAATPTFGTQSLNH